MRCAILIFYFTLFLCKLSLSTIKKKVKKSYGDALKTASDAWNTVISPKWTLLFCICFHNYRCQIAWFTRFQLTPESYKITFIWINGTQTRSLPNQEKHVGSIKYSRSCKISSFPSPPFFFFLSFSFFCFHYISLVAVALFWPQYKWGGAILQYVKKEKQK